ncbi:hypothetical protein Emed_002563 [Eimeria media]
MLVSILLFCFSALLSLLGIRAAAPQATVEYSLIDASQCLTNVNEARQAAGLPKAEKKSLLPSPPTPSALLKAACYYMLKEYPDGEIEGEVKVTPALFPLEGQANPDCSAAVKNWQGGYQFFETHPPVNENVFYSGFDPQALAFVALYNPSNGIQGDCQVVVCSKKPAQQQNPSKQALPQEEQDEQSQSPEPEKEGNGESPPSGGKDNATSKTASALLCVTSPDAFANKPLFT